MSKARPDTQYLAAAAETARAVETVEVVAPRRTVDRWIARLPVMKLRLYLDLLRKKMSERQTKAGNQITLSLSLTLTLSHYLTLTLLLCHTHELIQSLFQSLLTC